jgi:hypothetical protein
MATQIVGATHASPFVRGVAWLTMITACTSPTTADTVAVDGTILRGPLQPVCQVGQPCDGPLVAEFVVARNGRRVLSFRTDAAGRFAIALAPGSYSVTPSADAPIMGAGTVSQPLTVVAPETRGVTLQFDTGIR